MAKSRIEKASDAWVNPPTPQDPTSDVTRNEGSSGEPLHKAPMRDDEGNPIEGDNLPTDEELEERREAKRAAREARTEDRSPEEIDEVHRRQYEGSGEAAVTSPTGRDANADGVGGPADQGAERWADDPMPEGAQERLEWAQRGTDTAARIDAALRAEEGRGSRRRPTLMSGLRALQAEHKANERADGSSHDN